MKRTSRRRERGNQLIELAMVLPMIMMLALLVSEGASALRAHIVLNNAAREGAHFSSLPENQCVTAPNPGACITAIRNAVITYAANNGITLAAANVAVNQALTIPAAPVALQGSQVTVTYQFPLTYLPPFINAFFGAAPPSATLVGQAEFQNFY